MQNNYPPLGAIFGEGRSGTSWLGTILSSHPEIVYRLEPFHRLSKTNVEIQELQKRIKLDAFSYTDISLCYRTLLPANALCESPPFFFKHHSMRFPLGRQLLLPLARNSSLGENLFRWLYTPKGSPMLIFKEVAMSKFFLQLLARTDIPMVYLMRNPCAVVWSQIRGQNSSLMTSGRRRVLGNMLENHDPILAERYLGRLETLSICEQEALMWRVQLEPAVQGLQTHGQGLLVIYEKLVQSPLEVSQNVFNHFGLEMTKQSVSFIEESTSGGSFIWRLKRGEIFTNPYFSVFKDPKVASNSWKDDMPREERDQVMGMVRDSKVFALGAEQGLWD